MCHYMIKSFLLLSIALCNVVCDDSLPITEDQLEYLADGVCQETEKIQFVIGLQVLTEVEETNCGNLFMEPIFSSEPWVDKTELVCISEEKADLFLTPEPHVRVLIPVAESNSLEILRYSVIESNKRKVVANILPDHEYWISNFESQPMVWRKIHGVINCSNVHQKIYNITEITSTVYEEGGKQYIEAQFEWDSYPNDSITVNAICQEGKPMELGPSSSRNVTIRNLKFGEECQILIDGNYGRGILKYKALVCDNKSNCEVIIRQEDINITAGFSQNGSGYDVNVKWPPPPNLPSKYDILLCVNDTLNYSATSLPNTSSECTFNNVMKSDNDTNFFVKLITIARRKATVVKVGRFPLPKPPSQLGVIIAGTLCIILSGGIIIVSAVVYVRRTRFREMKKMYYEGIKQTITNELSISYKDTLTHDIIIAEDCWELKPDRLLLHEVIGEGAFGVVRRGFMSPEGNDVAVKMLKDFPSVEEVRSFRAEMELMKSVGVHPHVVSLVGCCSGRRPMIVAEYCSQGDLLNFLRCSWDVITTKNKAKYYNNNLELSPNYGDVFSSKIQQIPEELSNLAVNKLYDLQPDCEPNLTVVDLLSFCRQIVLGMEFLASNRVVHRDLAARNILVTKDRTLKIADFGLSRDVYQENQYKQKGTGKLPIKWMALESLTNQVYTSQSDVWSFGIVMWEIVTVGGSPYPEVPTIKLLRYLKDGYRMPKPNNCSKPLYEVMRSCWRIRPRDRPTFSELHVQLDTLLNEASADDYLSLDVQEDTIDHTINSSSHYIYRYFGFIPRRKRQWCKRSELYEKPVKSQSNYYSEAPYSKTQVTS